MTKIRKFNHLFATAKSTRQIGHSLWGKEPQPGCQVVVCELSAVSSFGRRTKKLDTRTSKKFISPKNSNAAIQSDSIQLGKFEFPLWNNLQVILTVVGLNWIRFHSSLKHFVSLYFVLFCFALCCLVMLCRISITQNTSISETDICLCRSDPATFNVRIYDMMAYR